MTRSFKTTLPALIGLLLTALTVLSARAGTPANTDPPIVPNPSGPGVPAETKPSEDLLTLAISLKTDVLCHGDDDGLAVVLGVGGLPPFVYLWSNGSIGPINANLSAGVYTVTCTDLLGATATLNVTIEEPELLDIQVAAQANINCLNASGSVTLDTDGGTGNANIIWVNGQVGTTLLGLDAGVYVAIATDQNGCTATETVNITADLDLPDIDIDLDADLQIDCNTLSVELDASASAGGNNPTYLWTTVDGHVATGGNTPVATVDAAGTYLLRITNNTNGCTNTESVHVTANLTLPVVDINANVNLDLQLDCLTPELTLSGQGSAVGPGILYLWTTVDGHIVAGANTLDHLVVNADGTYVLQVTNTGNGCSATDHILVTADLDLPIVDIDTDVDLQLDCINLTVDLDATASTGGSGINYLWTTVDGHILAGINTNLATVDAAGTYLLHITDTNNGCSGTASVDVTANLDLPVVNISVGGLLDCNHSSLILDAGLSSQGTIFACLWTTVDGNIVSGANTLHPTVNEAGVYVLVITNLLNGCTASGSVTVGGTSDLEVSIGTQVNVGCFGLLTGSVSLNVTGGTGPYTYLWSNGMVTASISGLAAGVYLGTVTDANGCQSVISVNIGQASQLQATSTTIPASGTGQNNGSATVLVTGGTAPYTYLWSNGMTGNSVSGLAPGTYTVTVTDAAGCSVTITVVIGSSASCLLTVSLAATAAECGQSNGAITANSTNGSGTVTYAWNNGMTGAQLTGLAAGTYSVTASDGQGCTAVSAVVVHVQDNTDPIVGTQNITIYLDASGNASVTAGAVNNGSSDACGSIMLNLDTNVFDCDDIGTHIVTLTVTDQAGNISTGTAVVTVVDNIAPSLSCPANIEVNGCGGTGGGTAGNGSVDYDAPSLQDNCPTGIGATVLLTTGLPSGSTFPNGTTTVTYLALTPGGAPVTCSFTVTVSGGLDIEVDVTSPSCPGESDGSASVAVTGGDGNYTYLWIGPGGQTSTTGTGLGAGFYQLIVTDGSGCMGTANVAVNNPASVTITTVVLSDDCDNTGSLSVTVAGGTGPYTYVWYDANGNVVGTTATIEGVTAGDYMVVVTDANGCTFSSGILTLDLTSGTVENQLNSDGIVEVMPNPTASGAVTLSLQLPEYSQVRVEMYGMNGALIGNAQEGQFQEGQFLLNMASFAPGQYLVKVITDEGVYTKKVLRIN